MKTKTATGLRYYSVGDEGKHCYGFMNPRFIELMMQHRNWEYIHESIRRKIASIRQISSF